MTKIYQLNYYGSKVSKHSFKFWYLQAATERKITYWNTGVQFPPTPKKSFLSPRGAADYLLSHSQLQYSSSYYNVDTRLDGER